MLNSNNNYFAQLIKDINIQDQISFFQNYAQRIVEEKLKQTIDTYIKIIYKMNDQMISDRFSLELRKYLTPTVTFLDDCNPKHQQNDLQEEYERNIAINSYQYGESEAEVDFDNQFE